MPAGPAGMYAPAPFGLPTAPLNYQQRFGTGAMGQQPYDTNADAAIDAAANAERLAWAAAWAVQGAPSGPVQAPRTEMSSEVARMIFELGRATMMREEQEAHGAMATSQTAAPAAPTQMMPQQQLAMGALNTTAPLIVTEVGTGSGTTSNGALARQRAASPPKATGDEA